MKSLNSSQPVPVLDFFSQIRAAILSVLFCGMPFGAMRDESNDEKICEL